MKKFKLLLTMLMLMCFSVGQGWAADELKATLDFTSNAWSLPEGSTAGLTDENSYSNGTYTIKLSASTKYYYHTSGYLIFGKTGSKLTLPAFSWKTTKIVVTGRSGASSAVGQNVYVGTTAVSTATTGATGTNTYNINSSYQAAGNVYVLQVTSNANTQITKIEIYGESSSASVSVEKNGSAITELDFGEYEPEAGYKSLTFDLKASNLTGNVYIEPSNTAKYRIAADNYPNGLAYLTVKPTNGSIDTTITIWASTLNSGTYNATLSLTSTKETPEFSEVSLGLKLKVLGPEITLKDNDTSEPINEINFGNVGKNRDKSAQFAFGYKRMETGELTITVSDDFEFSGGKQTESYNITSASGTTYYVSIYKKTTTVKNITDGWIKFTGCGLPSEGVFYDVKMNVKEPKVSINITSDQDHPYNFGNIKQHEVCSDCGGDYAMKTIHITGEYLGSDLFTAEWGSIFDLSPSRIYVDEDGMVDQDLNVYIYTGTAGTYAYDRTDDNKGWKMRIYSGAVTPEFEEIEIYPSVTIVPTYGVNFQVYDNDRGTITINGIESSSNGKVTAYVVDDNEEITMVATPKIGWKFSDWQVDNADKSVVAIDDVNSASTYAYATAATQGYITAMFVYDCKPLTYPRDPEVADKTYNSAELAWGWVKFDPEDPSTKLATYKVKVTEVGTDNVIIEDVSFTSADLAYTMASTIVTGLKANTDYKFVVWATTNASGYCEDGEESAEVEFTTKPYPAATLTLSENGKESAFGSNLKVADVVTLPSTVSTEVTGKVFVGWSSVTIPTPTDTKPGAATYWEKGASYTIQSTADKLYAVYATATPGTATSYTLGTATLNGSATGGNTASTGYSIQTTSTSNKSGYVQDNGTADVATVAIKLYVTNSETQIISSKPSAIKVVATLGGGSAKDELGHNVFAVLLDNSNNDLGDPVVLTTSIASTTGSEYTASLPVANYADVRGVKIYHLKENGYNVRYFSFDFKYETGGEYSYSGYVTQGARVLDAPTFSPAEGTYTTAQNISLSAEEGDIYYTINGADPTSASTKYTAAIALNEYGTYTIKAKAIDGESASAVASKSYFINLPFASLEALIAKSLPAAGTNDVTVSFSGIAIDSIKNSNKNIYLHVQDGNGKDIYIYNGAAGCPSTWAAGGSLSGTITGTWKQYKEEWEIVPNSGFEWSSLTYSAAAPSLTLSKTSVDFGDVAKGTSISEDAMKIEMVGANLTGDVTVSAATVGSKSVFSTNGFKPSGTYTPTDGVIDVNVLAIPTTNKAGNFSGSLTFHSETGDFEDKVVSLHIHVTSDAGIAWAAAKDTTYTVGLARTPQALTNPNKLDVTYSSSDQTVATIASNGTITPLKQGTTTIKASFAGNDDYEAKEVSYTLQVWAPKAILLEGTQSKTSFEYGDYFNPATDGKYTVQAVYGDAVPYIYSDVTSEASWLLDDEDIASKQITGEGQMTLTAKWGGFSKWVYINTTIKKHKVLFDQPANGEMIIKRSGKAITSGYEGVKGQEFTVTVNPSTGYALATLTVNGEDISSTKTFTLGTEDVTVVATLSQSQIASGLGWRYSGADVTTHAHTFGASTERFYFPSLKNPNEIDLDDIEFISSDSTVAEFGARTHEYSSWFAAVWVKKAGTAVMTARLKNHATYDDIEVSYTLTVSKGELAANQFRWFQYPDIYDPESDTYTWYESHSWPYINASSTYVDKANEVTYESTNTAVATISSTGSITPVANGSTVIKANFIGNDMFNAKTVQFTLNVQKASPVLSWSVTPSTENTTVDMKNSFDLTAFPRFGSVSPNVEALRDLVVLSSSDPTVAEINSNGYVNPLAEGQTTIKLSLAATDKSNAAEELSYTFTVTDSRPTLTIVAGDHGTYQVKDNSGTYVIESGSKVKANTNLYLVSQSAETGYKNTPVYKVVKTADNTDVTAAAINGSYLRMQAFDITISATYPEKQVAPIGWSSTETQYAYTDDRPYTLPTLVNAGLPVTFASSNTNVATISYDGKVSVWSAGTTNISVSYAGDGNYKQTTVSYELVVRSPHHLNVKDQPTKLMYDYGETINFTGMTATLYYDAEKTDGVDVTDVANWYSTPATVTASGNMTLTASYKGKQDSKQVYIYLKQYTVSFSKPTHGTIVVKQNGNAISTGDQFPKGTVLTVEATPDAGYALATLTANGEDIMSSKQITIGTTEVTIAATFKQGPSLVSNTYSIDFGEAIINTTDASSRPYLSSTFILTGSNLTGDIRLEATTNSGGSIFSVDWKAVKEYSPVDGAFYLTIPTQMATGWIGDFYGKITISSKANPADFEPVVINLHGKITDKHEAGLSWGVSEYNLYPVGPASTTRPELSNPNNLNVTYSSSNPAVATVSEGGWVSAVASGDAVITASYAGNDTYKAGEASYTVHVHKANSIQIKGGLQKTYGYEAGDQLDFTGLIAKLKYDGDDNTYQLGAEVEWSADPISVNMLPNQCGLTVTASAYGVSGTREVSVTVNLHAVTFTNPQYGYLSIKKGDSWISSGESFPKGTELTVVANPIEGYELNSITINGEVLEGNTFTVGAEAMEVVVTFKPKSATALDNVETEEPASKILLNNQLFIIRGEKMYDATGRLVK